MSRTRLLAAATLLAACAVTAHAERALVLAGGTVVDGYGNTPLANGVVVIEGERIVAVGSVDSVVIPPDAEVISTEGMTVMPGLWDLQVHLARLGHGDEQRWSETYAPIAGRVVMPLAARQLLDAGVTSARALAAPLDAAVSTRDRIRERRIPGPTLFVTGPALVPESAADADPWHWPVEGAAAGRERVARLAAGGADYLLLGDLDLWPAQWLADVVNEARVRGLPVHAFGKRVAGVERGLEAGVDGFVGLDFGAAPEIPAPLVEALRRTAAAGASRRLVWSPAISGVFNYEDLVRNAEPLDDPAVVAALPPLVARDILGSLARLDRVTWYDMPASRAPTLCTKLRQLESTGVRLVLGSDSGAPAHLHARSTWQEIDYWVRACGIDPAKAIQAATHEAALALRVEHESGTLAPGKYADVIAVRGDVLRNPALLQRVDIVIQRGLRHR